MKPGFLIIEQLLPTTRNCGENGILYKDVIPRLLTGFIAQIPFFCIFIITKLAVVLLYNLNAFKVASSILVFIWPEVKATT
jgi:hypothetical protein